MPTPKLNKAPEKQKKRLRFFNDDSFLRGMPRLKPEFILSAAQTHVTMWNPFPQAVRGQHAIEEFSSPMVILMLFAT